MMNDERKMAFIQNMAHIGLSHISKVANLPTPDGKTSHEKMLSFVQNVTKHGLQHLDGGGLAARAGVVPQTNSVIAPSNAATNLNSTGSSVGTNANTVNNSGLIGSIGSALGLNNNFTANTANITPGTNAAQLNQSYNDVQGGLTQQQGVANTLTPGIAAGANTQSNLTDMLTNEAKGIGPNPAQAELNQNTGRNIAQSAALAAGQRGAGANVGLAARENAQQAAATQQNAVGQAATLEAQQQLAAQNNLQNLSATQVAEGTGAVQGINNAQQNEQNILQNANTAGNNAAVQMQSNINNVNAGVSEANQNQASNVVSGIGGLLSNVPVIGSLFAKGGQVTKEHIMAQAERVRLARGGAVRPIPTAKPRMYATGGGVMASPTTAPQSFAGQWLQSNSAQAPAINIGGPLAPPPQVNSPFAFEGKPKNASSAPDNDPTMGSGISQLAPSDLIGTSAGGDDLGALAVHAAYKGGLMQKGGKVKAKGKNEKATVADNSLTNDKVPTMLSEGEIVLPRSVTMHPMAPEKAAQFVRMTLAKKGMR